MKVAITGAGGYLGGLLVRAHAARGDAVHALARDARATLAAPGVTGIGVDLQHPERVPQAFFTDTDVLYHCAAEISDEALMRRVNVDATRALLERSQGQVRHWVQVSSLSVYGRPRAALITEDSPLAPETLYARTKAEADALVAKLGESAFTHAIVRPSGVIGRSMRNRSMHALIDAVARGRFAYIGAPGAIGNFVHEDNVVQALLACGAHPAAHARTYNVSQNCPIERMIEAIASALGMTAPRLRLPAPLARLAAQAGRVLPGFPLTPGRVEALTSRIEYSTARIERELDYRNVSSVEDALRDLVVIRQRGRE